jgi:glycosyltransferase involved in cell wall biosynthesis
MNNLHITLTEFRNESRVLKEVTSILKLGHIQHAYIVALHSNDLDEHEEIGGRISIRRFKLKSRLLSRGLMIQAIKYLEFVFKVLIYSRKKNIGIVNIHALDLLVLGYLFKFLSGAKLIYDTHELETEINGSSGLRKKLRKLVEKCLIKKVDHVIVVSESIADWYADTYKISRPIVVLNAPKVYSLPESDIFRETLAIRKDQLIILYQGGLAKGRGVELLISAFKKRQNDFVVIVFMGYGELEHTIKEVASNSKRIFFHPAVPPNVVLDYTVSADIGVSLIENTCLSYYYCMPNKLFEYAMSSLPVIVSNMKEMRKAVENFEMGVVVGDFSVDEINKCVDRLLEMDLQQMKANARKMAEINAWEVQEEKMLTLYRDMGLG